MTGLEAIGMAVWVAFLFIPLLLLLLTAWAFVRWQNELEDEAQKAKNKKTCIRLLVAAVATAVVLFVLHLIFPLPT